jgi:iron complex outermembrane recepter protein
MRVVNNSKIGVDRLRLLRTVLMAGCFGFAPLVQPTTVEAQSARSFEFSIAGQSLSAALVRYSSVTGIDIVFDGPLPSNLRASGISGNLPAESALTKLLAGTGLTYRFTTATTVLLINPAATSSAGSADSATALQPIILQGEQARGPVDGFVATQSATGTKTDTSIKNTPQAINVVTKDQMAAQGSATLTQALRYTPGVISQYGDDSRYDWFTIRGFRPSRYLDGLRLPFGSRGYAQPRVEPFGLERAEVLKGPASVLYGQGDPGGLINMVSKRPSATAPNEIEIQIGTDKRIQTAFDLGGTINGDDSMLYRIVGVGRLTDTQYDYVREKKAYIAPSFTFRPDEGTSLTLYGSYQRIDSPGGGGAPALPANGTLYTGIYPELPRGAFPGEPGFDHYKSNQASVGYEFEHELDDNWTLRQNLRYSYIDTDSQRVQAACIFACTPTGFDRYAWAFPESARGITVDNQAVGHFQTGDFAHTALFGLDYSYESSRYEETDLFSGFMPAPFDGIDPAYGTPVPRPLIATRTNQDRSQIGLYAQDQVEWDRFVFSLGGRYDWATTDTRTLTVSSGALKTVDQNDGRFTWRAGLVYNFDNGFSPYAGYSTSFSPAGTDSAGTVFQPTTGEQFEIGVKYQPEGSNSFVTLSAYHLTQDNVLTPISATRSVQTGQVTMRGVELEGKAEINDTLSILASYAYTDSEITKDNSNQGNRFAFVPRHQASLWLDYALQTSTIWDGLSFGGGARYTGQTFGDNANKFDIPSYTVFDAAVRYDFGKSNPKLEGLKASLNVSNLFDRKYVSTCIAATGCYWGEGRSVYATLKYSW